MSEADDLVRAIEQEVEAPFLLITAAYESDPKRVIASLLTEYRCRRAGCLLWRAWLSSRYGACYYRPPYQLSPLRNERTTNPKLGRSAPPMVIGRGKAAAARWTSSATQAGSSS